MTEETTAREQRLAVYDPTTYGATDDGDPTGGGPYMPGSAIEEFGTED